MRQTVLFALCVSLSMAMSVAAKAAAESEELIPEDTCIVELTLPEGATVTVDGEDYGAQRKFTYGPLTPKTTYEYEYAIHYPSGETSEHTLLLEGGRRVRLAKRDPGETNVELVEMAGMPPIGRYSCSQDWKYLIAEHQTGAISIWDRRNQRLLRVFADKDMTVNGSAAHLWGRVSPDGTKLLAPLRNREGTPLALYEVSTGQLLRTLHVDSRGMAYGIFSPDGNQVFSFGGTDACYLWDVATGKRLRTFDGHSHKEIPAAAFSPDGKNVLTGSWDKTAILWDIATGRRLKSFEGPNNWIESVAVSPDGTMVLIGYRGWDGERHRPAVAILWDIKTGRKVRTCDGHQDSVLSVAFSPNGEMVLTGSYDRSAILWDTATGRRLSTFAKLGSSAGSVTFAPRGASFFVGERFSGNINANLEATIWNARTGKKEWSFHRVYRQNWHVSFASENAVLAVAGPEAKSLGLFNMATGTKTMHYNGICTALALAPDGTTLFLGAGEKDDASASLWDISTGRQLRTLEGHTDTIQSASFSPNGKLVLTASDDKTTILWDAATGERLRIFRGHTSSVKSVAFSPNGETAITGSWDNTAILWDVVTGQQLHVFSGHAKTVRSLTFSPDGRQVLTGSDDNTAILWDVATGKRLRTFRGHASFITSVAFSPNGRTAVTGSWNGTAILWNVTTGNQVRRFTTPSAELIQKVTFDPTGRHILAVGNWRLLYVWDVATGDLVARGSRTDDGVLFTTPEGLFDGPPGVRDEVCFRVGKGLNVLPVDQFFDGFYTPGLMDSLLRGERPLPQVDIEPPPAIQIVSPDSGGTIEQEQLTVEATIQDQGGGIQTPVVKLNGNRFAVDGAPVRENDKRLRWRFTIPLIPGVENTVEVHSATASGAIAGEPGRITVRCEKPKERPELYMVAVGISDYADGGPRDLDCAKNDAVGLAEVFRERGEAFYGAGKVHVTTVTDKQGTKKGIEEAIASVAKSAKPRDVFVLTLAGHGVTLGERYYFIPYDYDGRGEEWRDEKVRRQGLPEDELDDWIAAVPATKRILVYDTCQAGGALGRATSYEKTLESLARRSGCHVIAAASSNENAEELPDVGHGALTYALMAGLGAVDKGLLKGRSAPDKDGLVHAVDWFRFAAENVPALTKLRLGKEQYVEFKSRAADFAILPLKTKENDK